MAAVKLALFAKSKGLEAQIDEFLDTVSQGGMVFEETLKHYLHHGHDDIFAQRQAQIADIESNGDKLVRSILRSLYAEMLIPESRADVLSLLQDLDALLDAFERICFSVGIERLDLSDTPEKFHQSFHELVQTAVQAVEALIIAARAFFRDLNAVRDQLHKVSFLEGEADRIALHLKRELFNSGLPLSRKLHLRHFVDQVDSIADEAEDAADWLEIYTIRRSL